MCLETQTGGCFQLNKRFTPEGKTCLHLKGNQFAPAFFLSDHVSMSIKYVSIFGNFKMLLV